MNNFRALLDSAAIKNLEPSKDEHPFTYCMEVIVPAMGREGKEPEDPKAFCGWWKAEHAAEHIESRHLHVLAGGTPRVAQLHGREHLVIPVIALMEGVIHAINAETPEFVPLEVLQRAADSWNGRPLVLGHPMENGKQISANIPEVIQRQGFGTIYKSRTSSNRLGMEAWIDPKRLEDLGAYDLLASVRAGKPIEVSVGAYVRTRPEAGKHNGREYRAAWTEAVGDHLAFLPHGRGACSLEMGCGAHRAAAEHPVLYALEENGPTALGGPGSGNWGHAGRPGEVGGSASSPADKGGGSRDPHIPRAQKPEKTFDPFAEGRPASTKSYDPFKDKSAKHDPATAAKKWESKDRDSMTVEELAQARIFYETTQSIKDTAGAANARQAIDTEIAKKLSGTKLPKPGKYVSGPRRAPKYEDWTLGGLMHALEGLEGVDEEELRAAVGARNNGADIERIQTMHDTAVALGARCDRANYPLALEHRALMIKNEGGKWHLYTKDGSRKLGTHETKAEAEAQEKAIEAAKRRRSAELGEAAPCSCKH